MEFKPADLRPPLEFALGSLLWGLSSEVFMLHKTFSETNLKGPSIETPLKEDYVKTPRSYNPTILDVTEFLQITFLHALDDSVTGQ